MEQLTMTIKLAEPLYRKLERRAVAQQQVLDDLINDLLTQSLAEDTIAEASDMTPAEFIAALNDPQVIALYAEVAEEDRALANAGLSDYRRLLAAEDSA